MKEILLQNSTKTVTVDDSFYESLNKFKWYLRLGYAARYRSIKEPKGPFTIWMHRIIANTPFGSDTDHVDGNTLNNCINNLRVCDHSNNTKNAQRHKDNKSGYKGVTFDPRIKTTKWIAEIMCDGKRIRKGGFKSAKEAAIKYDELAKKFHGEFAKLNFPN